jgi:diaminohydroxyphosphoribosylaminopyrimidine deaminase / 5-amino-6-(5-phosphoribosylamino)uracil reductase
MSIQHEHAMSKSADSRLTPFEHFKKTQPDRPFIVAQLGQSLDGRIATRTGDSRTIGSSASLDHLHRIRAHVDGIMVGIGTVLADDPRLNVRLAGHVAPQPARIIIDANARLSANAKCLDGADGARRIVFRKMNLNAPALPLDVEIVHLPQSGAGFDPRAMAYALGRLGFERILLEGGAQIISQFIEAKLIDRLHLMLSSVILGSGKSGLDLAPIESMQQALRPKTQIYPLGDGEVLFDCEMRGSGQ